MNNNKVSVIYAIKHIATNRVYVGSALDRKRRFKEHKRFLRKGAHANAHLQHAWSFYGESAFEFLTLEVIEDASQLESREQHWIDELKSTLPEFGFNLCPVAGSTRGLKYDEESKQKIRDVWAARQADPNYVNHWKGRKHTEETRAHMSDSKKNPPEETRAKLRAAWNERRERGVSEESRKKQSLSRKGKPWSDARRAAVSTETRNISEEARARISAGSKGKPKTPETRAKMAAAAKIRWENQKDRSWSETRRQAQDPNWKHSPETRDKMSEAAKARWGRRRKKLNDEGDQ